MTADVVTYESRERVAIITLNRPAKLNAIDNAVSRELRAAWEHLNRSDDRAAILTGAGRAFTAGADLVDSAEIWPCTPSVGIEVNKPIVCAVNGLCIGGGVVLLQFCDLAVAADTAWLSYPEAQIGFTGGLITSLAARIPHKIAMELILLGERMTAERAYAVGLVNRVVPGEQLLDAAMEYARKLAINSPLVIETLKQFVARTLPKGPTEMAAYARHMTERTYTSEDLAEGMAAFREKRAPRFEGR
jgi:enoyl-CoA hydratase/carnithine racemase